MTAFDTNRTAFGSTSVAARISSALYTVAASISAWNDARMTRNALSALSNRELDDIGLSRADIEMVANGR